MSIIIYLLVVLVGLYLVFNLLAAWIKHIAMYGWEDEQGFHQGEPPQKG